MTEFEEYYLNNGLKVGLVNIDSELSYVQLTVHQGAAHELPSEKGLSHLIEHIIASTATKSFSKNEINHQINLSPISNANTNFAQTNYFFGQREFRTENILNIIGEKIKVTEFDEELVASEKNRVIQEVQSQWKGENFNNEDLMVKLYGIENKSLVNPSGNESAVMKSTKYDLECLKNKTYTAANMDLIIAGKITQKLKKRIEKIFNPIEKGEANTRYTSSFKLNKKHNFRLYEEKLLNRNNREMSQLNFNKLIQISTEMYDFEDILNFRFIGYMLENPKFSPLQKEISSKLGWTYNIGAAANITNGITNLTIDTTTKYLDHNKLNDKIEDIISNLGEMIDINLFEAVKESMIVSKINSKVDVINEANNIRNYWDFLEYKKTNNIKSNTKYISNEEFLNKIIDLPLESIINFSNKYLKNISEKNSSTIIRDPLLTQETLKKYKVDNNNIYKF